MESLCLLFYCEIHELLRVQALQDRKETTMTLINLKDLEAHLWHAAHIITGPIDASDYKTYIFPILFFKRICDVYDEEFADAMESIGDAELAKGKMFHRIQIP